ncbi:MAG: SUMF1/EgtB/PvdO family nonheme iron enzyme [Candidatus Methanosuratincola sp.]
MNEARGYCQRCQVGYPAEFRYCMACGGALSIVSEQVRGSCSRCGARTAVGAKFCDWCGAALSPAGGPEITSLGRCTQCGSPYQAGEAFCTECGARLTQSAELPIMRSEASRCPRCGGAVEAGMRFCLFCGHALVEGASSVERLPSADESAPPSLMPERVMCPRCGAEVEAGLRYCLFCGASLALSAVIEPVAVSPIRCPHCAAELEPEMKFCIACGRAVHKPSVKKPVSGEEKKETGEIHREIAVEEEKAIGPMIAHESEVAAEEAEREALGPVVATEPCPQCGLLIEVGAESCTACGYDFWVRQEQPRGRRLVRIEGVIVVLLVMIGGGGWVLYQHHAPTRAAMERVLVKIGVVQPTLEVVSSPAGCRVIVDGEIRGVTDQDGRLVIGKLKKGEHLVRLEREGYESKEQRIEIAGSRMTVRFQLSPISPPGMVFIPGGTFRMGRDDGDEYERPAHEVTVGPFFMDRMEVTNFQYHQFIRATGHRPPPHWQSGLYPLGQDNLPVTHVSWNDANAYCQWAGKRLPTEAEWEFAARGTDGRLYPWGNQWGPDVANAGDAARGGTAPVGSYPKGESPFKVLDLVGNVWEWTASELRAYPGGWISEETLPESERRKLRVIRGGCYLSNSLQATATYRMGWPAEGADYAQTGIRCVKDAPK